MRPNSIRLNSKIKPIDSIQYLFGNFMVVLAANVVASNARINWFGFRTRQHRHEATSRKEKANQAIQVLNKYGWCWTYLFIIKCVCPPNVLLLIKHVQHEQVQHDRIIKYILLLPHCCWCCAYFLITFFSGSLSASHVSGPKPVRSEDN